MAKAASGDVIALPKGGGAMQGIGEKFSADLHTGTGNFTVPIALPPGRNGFQPQINLAYSTGNGNGPFGLGWSLSLPGISRKTSKGIPRYDDAKDVFVLSGAEDLVPVEVAGTRTRYQPRTEGTFARIYRHTGPAQNYWEVKSKDGLVSLYGAPGRSGSDFVIADPDDRTKVFTWKLSETRDPFGNRIVYEYERDGGEVGPHRWDQLCLKAIRYADYQNGAETKFLVSVGFDYEDRHDGFSEYRAGFEVRTTKRCKRMVVRIHEEAEHLVRTYELIYLDKPIVAEHASGSSLPSNGVSLLHRIRITGHDGEAKEELPPLEFGYTAFEPAMRKYVPLTGRDSAARSLGSRDLELVDLFGNGLPDIVEMNGTVRYWRNLGEGRFDLPRSMPDAPAGLALADAGVQLIDANGDGRTDLLVTKPELAGYYSLTFDGRWNRKSFQGYEQPPGFNLEDPEVRLVDLDGDGVTDAIRSGTRLECFFNDPEQGWLPENVTSVPRQRLDEFPDVNFSDQRVKWADMTGDGLQDIALIHNGRIDYWPNLGRGRWGKRITMRNSPRFEDSGTYGVLGYDPKRILIGDVDGDGVADLVYVASGHITVWINQSGNGWSEPLTIRGTPAVTDLDAVRLADIHGTGTAGILWTSDYGAYRDGAYKFLDLTGGIKPYLLNEMDNHIGAKTKVAYASSTHFYLMDLRNPQKRWRTTLPFPVQVVSRVEVVDDLSKGRLTTEYRYHHGYWDGTEREFRGFGMVEQLDTESFGDQEQAATQRANLLFQKVDRNYFSPPLLTKTWFHQGAVWEEDGGWGQPDYASEYWAQDSQILQTVDFRKELSAKTFLMQSREPRVRRDALRALRGSVLRTELYALDGTSREERPYTVTENAYGLREESIPGDGERGRAHIFFPFKLASRTTQWERGDDPMTQFGLTDDYDPVGQPQRQTQIACPRGWKTPNDRPAPPYLATRTRTVYAKPNASDMYIHDRVAKTASYEIRNTSDKRLAEIAGIGDDSADLTLIGLTLHYYDGTEFDGLPSGQVGPYGALARTENLVLTEEILRDAYRSEDNLQSPPEAPPYLDRSGAARWTADYPQVFRDQVSKTAGYAFHLGGTDPFDVKGFFAQTERRRYDFHDDPTAARGLVTVTRDSLGRDTTIGYDGYRFLPNKVTDPAGLTTTAEYDYRIFQPREVTDSNGNKRAYAYTALGLLKSIRTWGEDPTAYRGDRTRASVSMDYDFLAFDHRRQPISVRTLRYVHHDQDADISLPERDEIVETREYSDGFGRLLQTRTQGEAVRFGHAVFGGDVLPPNQADEAATKREVKSEENGSSAEPNVVVSGWQRYDNKGRVVEKYEPFFSEGWEYAQPEETQNGKKATMFHDSRGRVFRTVNPDRSEQRVVFGVPGTRAEPDLADPNIFEPTPWETYAYDANDNAGRTDAENSTGYGHHWNTPNSAEVDALRRTIKAIERNGPDPTTDWFVTRSSYDIRGNLLTVTDPLGRVAFEHVYDLANRPWRVKSIDAGVKRTVLDAAGNVVEQRDSKGALILHAYDTLNRPTHLWARDGSGLQITLREKLIYGDDPSSGLTEDQVKAGNLKGKLYQHYDEAGRLTFVAYDFKGNLLEKTRQVIADSTIDAGAGSIGAFVVDWDGPAALEGDYRTSMTYDALNRIKTLIYPQDVDGERKVLRPHYNRAGALERVNLDGETYVEHIAYNAKGQRTLIAYGNGVMARYAYDPESFRLVRLRTERYTRRDPLTYRPAGLPLQDFAYSYDLSGNILKIRDRTPESGIVNTVAGIDALDRQFSYDPSYRLLSATGRQHDAPPPQSLWEDRLVPADPTRARPYRQDYAYDKAGNLIKLQHQSPAGDYAKHLALITDQGESVPKNNRLSSVTVGQTTYGYEYDENGNMRQETASRLFEWDHSDRLRVFRNKTGDSTPTVHARYLYDAGGQRVKKVVRKGATDLEVTVYIDGVFEHHLRLKKNNGTYQIEQENNTLHVMDNQSRIALLRAGDVFPGDGAADKPVQYHLGDHLGGSHIVVGGATATTANGFMNSEEYFPYGETSFGSFARKRYRFTGKERDEESGLYYHGARYYAPWLARWVSCDPAGRVDGNNLFVYASSNPARFVDRNGLWGSQPTGKDTGIDIRLVEEFNKALKSNLPEEKTPTTAREKSVDVNIDTAEHDRAVVDIVNAAIDTVAKNARNRRLNLSEFEFLKSAQENLIVPYRNQNPDTSQNLILRDADRYLTGRLQFWRKYYDASPGPTTSPLTIFMGEIVAERYNQLKRDSFRANPKPDEPNAKSSEDQSPFPGSAPGGRFWHWLGGRHLEDRGRPTEAADPAALKLSFKAVQEGRKLYDEFRGSEPQGSPAKMPYVADPRFVAPPFFPSKRAFMPNYD